jgi:hypothetical protein
MTTPLFRAFGRPCSVRFDKSAGFGRLRPQSLVGNPLHISGKTPNSPSDGPARSKGDLNSVAEPILTFDRPW